MEDELKKRDNESRTQYIYRLATMRDCGKLDMTWDELARVLNAELGLSYGSSAYRKPYTQAMTFYNEVFANTKDSQLLQDLRKAKQELYKERTLLRDERNELNKQLREEARMEKFMDSLKESLAEQSPVIVRECKMHNEVNTEAIVCLSDLHVGATANNKANVYNTEVMFERLREYLDEINEIQNRHHACVCDLCLLGDIVSGSIHASITATNSMHTVEQVKTACKALSFFIGELSTMFDKIRVFSVNGNHSRINKNAEDNIPGDNLDSLITFYLDAATKNDPRVLVYSHDSRAYGYSNVFYTGAGRLVAMTHGDMDAQGNVVNNMIQVYGEVPNIILMGHMHHSAYNTVGKTRVIQSGSLCGVDGYAFGKRLFAPPEQTVVITSNRKTVECVYNVSFEDEEARGEQDGNETNFSVD